MYFPGKPILLNFRVCMFSSNNCVQSDLVTEWRQVNALIDCNYGGHLLLDILSWWINFASDTCIVQTILSAFLFFSIQIYAFIYTYCLILIDCLIEFIEEIDYFTSAYIYLLWYIHRCIHILIVVHVLSWCTRFASLQNIHVCCKQAEQILCWNAEMWYPSSILSSWVHSSSSLIKMA